MPPHFLQGLTAAVGFDNFKTAPTQAVEQNVDIGRLIIYQQHTHRGVAVKGVIVRGRPARRAMCGHRCIPFNYFFTGRVMVNVVPLPGWLSTEIKPPS